MKKGKGRNSEEGTSEKDKKTDGLRVERAGVGEVREDGQVGCPGLEGCSDGDQRELITEQK